MPRKKTQASTSKTPSGQTKKSSSKPRAAPQKRSKSRQREPQPETTFPQFPVRSIAESLSRGEGLSLDQKLDLVGVLLALAGLLTLISLFSTGGGGLLGIWVSFWKQALGWGLMLFPLALLAVGLWLIFRDFERVPPLSIYHLLGVILVYVNLLVWLHFFLFPSSKEIVFAHAASGEGGGYIGAGLYTLMTTALGNWGTVFALISWLLIGLILALDKSVVDLFRWMPPLLLRLQDWWDERRPSRERPSVVIGSQTSASPLAKGLTVPAPDQVAPRGEQPAEISSREGEVLEWVLPPIAEMLDKGSEVSINDEFDRQRAKVIEETLKSFGAPAHVVEINRGPTITQFGVEPDFIETRNGRTRVRVGKIAALADDLALALAAKSIRIQAPVPGKGYVGIEVPNEEISLVALRDIVESEAFQKIHSPLRIALGQDVAGNAVAADLSAMPHLLIAGATGSGKSVCVNAIICCLLMHNTPHDLRILMVDPKRVELMGYNGIPHLLTPVVVELERVVGALKWVSREMDIRYETFAREGARNLQDYNQRMESRGEKRLPYLVVVIDELADLMMLAPDETERTITRLAQLARSTGIHLIISTQRPSVDVVTGIIKANFPARIAFAVTSGVDSRVIIDQPGAERLLGRGDMLFQAPDAPAPVRLQGVFVSDQEINRIVLYWRSFAGHAMGSAMATRGPADGLPTGIPLKQKPLWEEEETEEKLDPLFQEAVELVRRQGRASISMLQRRLRIGYTRAARIIDTMEEKGIITPQETGSLTRRVLNYGEGGPPAED